MSRIDCPNEETFVALMADEFKRVRLCSLDEALLMARSAFSTFKDLSGVDFGDPDYAWDADGAREIAREDLEAI